MKYKLGRKPKKVDPRVYGLRKYLTTLPSFPSSIDWSGKVSAWGMLLNDSLGDCAIAAPAHMDMLWTANVGAPVTITDQQVLSDYEAVGGYNPANPSTDRGCAMLDVLNYWRTTGIAGRTMIGYATLDIGNLDEMRSAIANFGAIYIGVNLEQSDMDSADSTDPWDGTLDPSKVIGGHAIPLVAYDGATFICVTWGMKKSMTPVWLQSRIDEAYVVISGDWINFSGVSPSGLNLSGLQSDISRL